MRSSVVAVVGLAVVAAVAAPAAADEPAAPAPVAAPSPTAPAPTFGWVRSQPCAWLPAGLVGYACVDCEATDPARCVECFGSHPDSSAMCTGVPAGTAPSFGACTTDGDGTMTCVVEGRPREQCTYTSAGATCINLEVSPTASNAWTPAAPAAAPPPPSAPRRRNARLPQLIYVGLELGVATPADDGNLYGGGAGRAVVVGTRGFELRLLEQYDLEDRAKMFDGAGFAEGRLLITSLAYRLVLADIGRLTATGLIGLAWLRRPLFATDPDDIDGSLKLRAQHGGAALLGVGVVGFGLVTLDVRAYPATWTDIVGYQRYQVGDDGTTTIETVTESPGGMPVTITLGIGTGF